MLPKKRLWFVIATTVLALGYVLYRYAAIMLFNVDVTGGAAISMPVVERGPILDTSGRILAIQTRLSSVTAWTPLIRNLDETADALSEALDLDRDDLVRRLSETGGFHFVKRKVSSTEAKRVQALIDGGKLPGISLRPESGRNYPERSAASHVLGYVGVDNVGLDGLEYTFNHVLSPPVVGEAVRTVYGNQIILTIDLNIQHAIDDLARATLTESRADSVMILVADGKNGDILGYSAIPDYDPNVIDAVGAGVRRNKPISLLYEPGSVFKIFTVAAALESGVISPDETFHCPGYFEGRLSDGSLFRIKCPGVHGNVNAAGILKYSCNAGAAQVSQRMAARGFYDAVRAFGFGERTGLPLNGEEAGVVRDPSTWSPRSLPTMAIGQELAVTAVQVLRAATVLTNKGVMIEPRIVERIVSPDGKVVKDYPPRAVRSVVSPETTRLVLDMLKTVTEPGGTARRAAIDGIDVSAKTGTAQVIDPETGKYSDRIFVASSLAVFPTADPRYIVYVVVEGPQGDSYFGGRVAAPVVRAAGDFLATYFGIERRGYPSVSHPGSVAVQRPDLPELSDRLPDYRGLSKRSLLPLLARNDLRVIMRGSGWVQRQDPPPGTVFRTGMTLTLDFE